MWLKRGKQQNFYTPWAEAAMHRPVIGRCGHAPMSEDQGELWRHQRDPQARAWRQTVASCAALFTEKPSPPNASMSSSYLQERAGDAIVSLKLPKSTC